MSAFNPQVRRARALKHADRIVRRVMDTGSANRPPHCLVQKALNLLRAAMGTKAAAP